MGMRERIYAITDNPELMQNATVRELAGYQKELIIENEKLKSNNQGILRTFFKMSNEKLDSFCSEGFYFTTTLCSLVAIGAGMLIALVAITLFEGTFETVYDRVNYQAPQYTQYYMQGKEGYIGREMNQCYYIHLQCEGCQDIKASPCITDYQEALLVLQGLQATRKDNEIRESIPGTETPGEPKEAPRGLQEDQHGP